MNRRRFVSSGAAAIALGLNRITAVAESVAESHPSKATQVRIEANIYSYDVDVQYVPNMAFSRYIDLVLQSTTAGIGQVGLGFSDVSQPALSRIVDSLLVLSLPLGMYGDIMYLLKSLNAPSIDVIYDPTAMALISFKLHAVSKSR